jgi:adenylate cyclase
MSLSRLGQRQGKCAKAPQLLAEVYGWLTEGFDTHDLQKIKPLLDELAPYRDLTPSLATRYTSD